MKNKRAAAILLSGLLAACTTVPGEFARPRTALPEEIASRYALPESEISIQILKTSEDEEYRRERGEIQTESKAIPFELFLPPNQERQEKAPFVLVLPYLQGSYFFPRLVCKNLARHGIAAAYIERPGEVFAPGQYGKDLESMTRATISSYRGFLGWVEKNPRIDGSRMGLAGMSMGAMVGVILMAAEPKLSRGVLLLPGCDLPEILVHSSEKKIRDYLTWRKSKDSCTPEQIATEFREHFVSDPASLAPYLESGGLLMVSARYDGVIPRNCSDRLWELLGKPTRIWLPTGHGTSGFCLPYIENKMVQHFSNWESSLNKASLAQASN